MCGFAKKNYVTFFLKKQKYRKYSKNCVKWPLSKRQKIGFQDQFLLNAGQKYCRMLQGEHSAMLSTFIKLPFVIKFFVLSIFEWSVYTGFTVYILDHPTGIVSNWMQHFIGLKRVKYIWAST